MKSLVEWLFEQAPPVEEELFFEHKGALPFSHKEHKVSLKATPEGLFIQVVYPEDLSIFEGGDLEGQDAFECFIDTRPRPDAMSFHRYCHHFIFIPNHFGQGPYAFEASRFKGDQKRELATSQSIDCSLAAEKKNCCMKIFLSSEILFGYDPEILTKIGFAYKIHRTGKETLFFPLGESVDVARLPALWATFDLLK